MSEQKSISKPQARLHIKQLNKSNLFYSWQLLFRRSIGRSEFRRDIVTFGESFQSLSHTRTMSPKIRHWNRWTGLAWKWILVHSTASGRCRSREAIGMKFTIPGNNFSSSICIKTHFDGMEFYAVRWANVRVVSFCVGIVRVYKRLALR